MQPPDTLLKDMEGLGVQQNAWMLVSVFTARMQGLQCIAQLLNILE